MAFFVTLPVVFPKCEVISSLFLPIPLVTAIYVYKRSGYFFL